jgi:hypothetical protein
MAVELTHEQGLDAAAAGALTDEPRTDDARAVEDEDIVGPQ